MPTAGTSQTRRKKMGRNLKSPSHMRYNGDRRLLKHKQQRVVKNNSYPGGIGAWNQRYEGRYLNHQARSI